MSDELMSDELTNLLAQTAAKVFAAEGAAAEGLGAHWRGAAGAGLDRVLASEAAGGIGAGFTAAQTILYASGRQASGLAIAEAILAAWLLDGGETQTALCPPGPLSLARRAQGGLGSGRFTGTLHQVAAGKDSTIAVLLDGQCFAVSGASAVRVKGHRDAAGFAFDTLSFEAAPVSVRATARCDGATLERLFGWARASQIGGAIDAVLDLSARHVSTREQFGRPLAKFQAIQQQMAVLTEEAAAANAATLAAAAAADRGVFGFELMASALRALRAAGEAASIAHQVHGAIGFTREYDLQAFTRRLWCWRSDAARERDLSVSLGRLAAEAGAEGYWPALVAGFPTA